MNTLTNQSALRAVLALMLGAAVLLAPATFAPAQDDPAQDDLAQDAASQDNPAAAPAEAPEDRAARLLAEAEAEAEAEAADQDAAAAGPQVEEQIDLLNLLLAGKWLMVPILLMSFLVVTFGVERGLALRRGKVLPPEFITGLGTLAEQKGGFDPRQAYKLCQQYPSAAASVVKTMLLKIGRPHTELEQAVTDARDREATRLYSNVRWLTLSAGVTPLMGLLGTVWGMIQAFFVTAKLPTGANKAEALAEGIYMALVTTFAGLAVAIPAAILAHFFEGRIQKLMLQLDETLLGLMPQLERFEGRIRVTRDPLGRGRGRAEDDKETPTADADKPTTADGAGPATAEGGNGKSAEQPAAAKTPATE